MAGGVERDVAGRDFGVTSEELGRGCAEVWEVVGNSVVVVRRGPCGCEMVGEAVGDGCEVVGILG